jgi:two-component system sensor histidine kinase/response regulator
VRRWRAALEAEVAEQRLARTSAEITERDEAAFLTAISHELRTPLNAILGFSQVLLDEIDGPLPADRREDVLAIRDAGERLRDLVDDVLDLATVQTTRVTLSRRECDLRPLVREVARLLEGMRRDRPVAIEVEIPDVLPTLHADPQKLRRVLTNLGVNALKATERGHVRLAVRGDGSGVVVDVSDTGPGIAEAHLGDLFREFHQVPSSPRRRTPPRGTGLGLAIVKTLVELHGGTVTVRSEVGKGSTFTVTLPIGPPA